jgi:hypothetical protein
VIKAVVAVVLLCAVVGGGWFYYQIDEGLEVGVRIVGADLSQEDEIPMTLQVRLSSELDEDVHVEYLEIEVRDREDGVVLVHKTVGAFTVPAHGTHEDLYDVVLRNIDAVEDTIWVEVLVRYDGETRQESRTIDIPV